MTTPPDPSPGSVPALIWSHADDVLRAEDSAAHRAAGPLRSQLDAVLQRFRLRWVQEFGKLTGQQMGPAFARLMADLSAALSAVQVDPAPTLVALAESAQHLGIRQGYIEAGLDPVDRPVTLDLDVHDYAAEIAENAGSLVDLAAAMAPTVQKGSFTAVARTVAVAQQGANNVDRAARTLTNEQVNVGIGAVADAAGGRKLWIAERDACVHCLALSGTLADLATGLLDATRTFGSAPLRWEPPGGLTGPPRHPNCRCRITPWFGHDTEGAESITHDWAGAIAEARAAGDTVAEAAAHKAAAAARVSASTDLPAALRREAERSVLNLDLA